MFITTSTNQQSCDSQHYDQFYEDCWMIFALGKPEVLSLIQRTDYFRTKCSYCLPFIASFKKCANLDFQQNFYQGA